VKARDVIPSNEAYGNAASLRAYCGAPKNAPIWGEVQHSLWLNDLYKVSERRSRLFPKLFTWNSIINFENSIPIGDPMGYFLRVKPPKLIKNPQEVILLPKFRRALTIDDRISQYKAFMSEAVEKLPDSKFVISIHPEELKYRDQILVGRFSKIRIHDPKDLGNPMQEYVNLFENARVIFTDYLGAHVFRAKSYFSLNCELTDKTWENPMIDSNLRPYFENFTSVQNDSHAREISDLLLGLNYMKSSDELSELLGLTRARSFFGKLIQKSYISYSQRT
jgi:hypothetical protein